MNYATDSRALGWYGYLVILYQEKYLFKGNKISKLVVPFYSLCYANHANWHIKAIPFRSKAHSTAHNHCYLRIPAPS